MSRTHIPRWLRERVTAQAGGRCGYCRTSEAITGSSLVIDHLIPEILDGPTIESNLWMACSFCNLYKGERVVALDPGTEEVVPLFNPREQRWSEHFRWGGAGAQIIGLTPTGRATVGALQLNRPLLVEARRLWARAGWHPPDD